MKPQELFNQLNLLFQTLSIAQCLQTYAPQQLQVPGALLDQRQSDTVSNSQVQGVIPSTVTSQPLTPLSTTRMSLPASTVNTTKEKAHISKRKNDVPVARSKKKPRAAKKGVRRGTTSSQANPAEDEFVDSWDEQIDFKNYKEVQETFGGDYTDAYCFDLTDIKSVSID